MDTSTNNLRCECEHNGYTSELEKLLVDSEKKIKDLIDNLTRCRMENANLQYQLQLNQQSIYAQLNDGPGSLGIHILPCKDGLVIQSILPGGRIDNDGRLSIGDTIVEVNDKSLFNTNFEQAQHILKEASQRKEIRLRFIKSPVVSSVDSEPPSSCSPPPLLPKPTFNRESSIKLNQFTTSTSTIDVTNNSVPVKPTLLTQTNGPSVTPRKLGKKYHVRLVKGEDGLGFTITTKDNPAGDPYPIFIKTISPKGAAIKDGTLKSGDRILQVNGIDLKSQKHSDVVSFLKNIEIGSSVDMIIARQESDISPIPSLPRPLPGDKGGEIPSSRQSEVFTFEIQSNDTSSAGLGISVKGLIDKFGCDMGLFVNKIIHGGAASKDGRLKVDDQIISVNGITLLGLSNDDSFKLMQSSFSSGAGHEVNPNQITVTIARYVQTPDCEDGKFLRATNESTNGDVGVSVVVYESTNKDDLDVSNSSYKSNENTIIFKPKEIVSPNDQLDAQFSGQHPVSNRLHGRTPSIRDRVIPVKMVNGEKSPNRSDVYIEEDGEDGDSLEISQTIPKSVEDIDDEELNALKPVESIISLADESEVVFQRDGFGRQSMSEKRHATLNVKNTDTYQRNKKAKEERERERQRLKAEYDANESIIQSSTPVTPSRMEPMSNSVLSSTPQNHNHNHNHHHQQQQHGLIETPKQLSKDENSKPMKPSRGEKSSSKNPPLFSPKCCWSCQSPGSCPYHIAPNTSTRGANSGAESSGQNRVGPNLGLKKSCSLESLQTMMQELQKDQLDGQEGNPFAGPRPATLKVSRNRATNESFRAAVDKSFDAATSAQQAMETLAEEGSESNSSLNMILQQQQQQQAQHQQQQQQQILYLQQQQQQQQQHHQQSQQQQYQRQPSLNLRHIQDTRLTHHSHSNGEHISSKPSEAAISTTTGTGSQFTTSGDDDIALIKRKNSGTKKGLIKTLFRLGSGKKSKSDGSSSSSGKNHKKGDYEDVNKIRARQAAQMEQERIQEHIRRFKEQQHHQQQQQHYHHQSLQQQPVQIFHQQTLVKSPIGLPQNNDHLPLTHFQSDPTIQYNQHQAQHQLKSSHPPQLAPHQSQIQSQISSPPQQQPQHTLSSPPTVSGQQAMKLNAHAGVIYGSTRIANHVRTPSGRMNAATAAAAAARRQYPVEIQERVDDRYDRTRLPPQQIIDLPSSSPASNQQHAGYIERPIIQTSTSSSTITRPGYGTNDIYATYDTPYGAVKRNVYPGSYRSATVDRNFNNRSTIYWGNSGPTTTTRTVTTAADATLRRPHSVYVDEYGRASIKRLGQRKVGDVYSYPPRHIT